MKQINKELFLVRNTREYIYFAGRGHILSFLTLQSQENDDTFHKSYHHVILSCAAPRLSLNLSDTLCLPNVYLL